MIKTYKPEKPPQSRLIPLQIVLTLTIISNVIGSAGALRSFDTFVAAYPLLNNALGYVYILCALIAVVGAYYLWGLKKQGFYVICVAFITVIILDLYAGIPVQHLLAASGLFILIIIVLIPVRKFLK